MNLCRRLAANLNLAVFAVAPPLPEAPRQEIASRLPVAPLDLLRPGIHGVALHFSQDAHDLRVEPHVLLAADPMSAAHAAQAASARIKPLPRGLDRYPRAPTRHTEEVALAQP